MVEWARPCARFAGPDHGRVLDHLRCIRHFAGNRRGMGAISPSGRVLAGKMCAALGPLEPGRLVIELGPGTGVFTRRLVRQYPGHPIVAIEACSQLAELLTRRYPEVHVIDGCASAIADHLDELGYRSEDVGGIVSGLPILSLPRDLRDRIFDSIRSVLLPGRPYVQFTYSRRAWRNIEPPGMRRLDHRRVFLNLPPAVVLPFERSAA